MTEKNVASSGLCKFRLTVWVPPFRTFCIRTILYPLRCAINKGWLSSNFVTGKPHKPRFINSFLFLAVSRNACPMVKTLVSCKVTLFFTTFTFLHGFQELLDKKYLFIRLLRKKIKTKLNELAGCACALDGVIFHMLYRWVNNKCFWYRRCPVFRYMLDKRRYATILKRRLLERIEKPNAS